MSSGEIATDSYYNTTPDKYNATYFHFYGIQADSSKPFRLMVNSLPEFKSDKNLDKVIVKLNLKEPKVAAEHIIRISVTAPAHGSISASKEKRFNITYSGPHFLIATTANNDIQILQNKTGNFADQGFEGSEPYASKNEGIYEQTQYVNASDASPAVNATPKTGLNTNVAKQTTTSNPTTPSEVVYDESILNASQKEKLAKFKEYREKGILTKRDYEKRLKELFDQAATESGKPLTTVASPSTSSAVKSSPSETTTTTTKPSTPPVTTTTTTRTTIVEKPSPVDLSKYQLSNQDKEDIAKLERFHQTGILTKDEFEQKRDKILANAPPVVESQPVQQTIVAQPKQSQSSQLTDDQKDQLAKLQKFVDMGILTQDEFEQKKKLIVGDAPTQQSASSEPALSEEQKEQLAKLQKFVDMGILTPDEFEQKKKMVIATTQPTQQSVSQPPQQQTTTPVKQEEPKKSIPITVNGAEAPSKTSTQLNVHVTNIKATADQPFKLILNKQHTMYQSATDIPESKEIVVKGDIPHWSNEDLVVTIGIRIPALGVEVDHELNITKDGRFIQIGVDNNEKKLSVKQQTTNEFAVLNATPKVVPPFRATGKTDIYLKVRGLKGSEEQPFKIFYMDREIYSVEEDMPSRQVGVVSGSMLKERRSNKQEEEDHEVLLTIKAPKLGIVEATATLNLTRDGGKLSVEVIGESLVVKQSVDDESFESSFKPIDLVLTKLQSSELSEQDFELLAKLKQLFDAGVLTEQEYQDKKSAVLNK